MVKVSITLPNKAQITFESEEPEVIHQIVQMALRDLPRDLMLAAPPVNGSAEPPVPPENGSNVTATQNAVGTVLPPAPTPPPTDKAPGLPVTELPEPPSSPTATPREPVQPLAPEVAAEQAFIQFCRSVNPLGDMRRVVVAIEGASRFLNLDSVDAEGLGRLFDLIGWRRPPDFLQTLRNAARSKFRWLERMPGRSGHYSATDLGRATILGG